MKLKKDFWILFISIAIFLSVILQLLMLSVKHNEGNIIYATDDAFIHMAIAKNFVNHGIWGVTKYGFTSSSSSILWTLLLSFIYFLTGVNHIVPIVLNIFFSIVLIISLYILLKNFGFKSLYLFLILMSIIFFTPLPILVFTGMEHVLHTLITIIFVHFAGRDLSEEHSQKKNKFPVLLTALSPLVTMSRYEGMFLIFIVSLLYMFRKRFLYGIILFITSMLPIAIFGFISMAHGWYFLPNSVLLKGHITTGSLKSIFLFFYNTYQIIITNPHMLVIITGTVIIFYLQYSKDNLLWKYNVIMPLIFILVSLFHIQFARISTKYFFRYEAYLVALGLFAMSISWHDYVHKNLSFKSDKKSLPKYFAMAFLGIFFILPLAERGYNSLIYTVKSTSDIYRQQYQMSLFLKKFYKDRSIAINDLGAVSYFSDVKILDIWGLGSIEVAKLAVENKYNADEIYKLSVEKQVEIASVYDLDTVPSDRWIKVAEWHMKDYVIAGEYISFYAVNRSETDKLINNLKKFKLDENVILIIK